MPRAKKSKPEIRADLEKTLSEIIAECYIIKDTFINEDKIRGVYFKTFLIDRANYIMKLQNFLNNEI